MLKNSSAFFVKHHNISHCITSFSFLFLFSFNSFYNKIFLPLLCLIMCHDNPSFILCFSHSALKTLQLHPPSFHFHDHRHPEACASLHADGESPCRPDVLSRSPGKTHLQHHGPQRGQCKSDTIVVG